MTKIYLDLWSDVPKQTWNFLLSTLKMIFNNEKQHPIQNSNSLQSYKSNAE